MLVTGRMSPLALTMLAVPAIMASVMGAATPAGANVRDASGGSVLVDGHTVLTSAAGKVKAGASIGQVGAPLLGGMRYTGTAATTSGEAWYQLDKTGAKTATIHVKNTSASGTTCTGLVVDLDNAKGAGGVVSSQVVPDKDAFNFPVGPAGLYYVEITGYDCTPVIQTTYSIEPETSSAWTTPTPPTAGTTRAGVSIGTVGLPLRGDTLYKGTAATKSGEAWYQLDKTGTKTATVRVEDTVVSGMSNCDGLVVDLDNAKGAGGVVSSQVLSDNGAFNFPVGPAGLYYIEITGYDCTPDIGTTYSIEPETSSAWATPTPPTVGKIKASASMATVGPPLRGDTVYKGTAATRSGEAWYQLDKTGTKTATVRVEDTVVSGMSNCDGLVVDLDNGSGGVVSSQVLSDNGAFNFLVGPAGLYYIEITGYDCTPDIGTTYSIEPEPSSPWTSPMP
jgi:hypothetical protein